MHSRVGSADFKGCRGSAISTLPVTLRKVCSQPAYYAARWPLPGNRDYKQVEILGNSNEAGSV